MSSISLASLKPSGQKLRLDQMPVAGVLADRLSEFGLFAGCEIQLLGQAFLKGSIYISFSGLQIALRTDEASQIKVELL